MDTPLSYRLLTRCVFASSIALSLLACKESKPKAEPIAANTPTPGVAGNPSPVLATVNGKPITELDVQYWLAKNTKGKITRATARQKKNMLEAIISQELIYQSALKLGLDKSPSYQQMLREKQVELNSLRRTAIRSGFHAHKLRAIQNVSDQEAKAYFDKHADKIRTKYHLYQIMRKSEADIAAIQRELASGKSFEEASGFAGKKLPKMARPPWDVGHLNWLQMPGEWRGAVDKLEPGQMTDILRGKASRRFWIVKLVEKKHDPAVTFDSIKVAVVTAIRREKVAEMEANMDRDLRAAAKIVYEKEPTDDAVGGP